ncbi:MAG: DUF2203 domain-containing protein [Firmicutes bacterium]|nr:DUF2203 domain-containing protein [Bacillota bacterium]
MDRIKLKFFTLEEANSLLPEIREKLQEINDTKDNMVSVIQQVHLLRHKAFFNGTRKQILEKARELIRYQSEIEGMHMSLMEKGLVVRDYEQGLVDFPTIIEGDLGYLSWLCSEDTIKHWHFTGDGEIKPLEETVHILRLNKDDNNISEN